MSEPLDPTIEKAHRAICADYLRQIAKLVDQGCISAFDLAWSTGVRKPVGKMVASASFLIGPVESDFLNQIAEVNRQIPVLDVTKDLQDHEPCEDEECALCNTATSS